MEYIRELTPPINTLLWKYMVFSHITFNYKKNRLIFIIRGADSLLRDNVGENQRCQKVSDVMYTHIVRELRKR